MAVAFHGCLPSNSTFGDLAASTTVYAAVAAGGLQAVSATESNVQILYRHPGTFSGFTFSVVSNRGALTAKLRIDTGGGAADGAQVVTTGASPNGQFSDTLHTDTISAGDKVNAQYVNGAGGSSCDLGQTGIVFAASTLTRTRLLGAPFTGMSGSGSFFLPVSGEYTGNYTTEADTQVRMIRGTWSHLAVKANTNTRSANLTFTSRINGAAGAQTLTVTASTPGTYEDTIHSDAIAVDDLICLGQSGSGGAGSVAPLLMSTISSSKGRAPIIAQSGGSAGAFGASASVYCGLGGPIPHTGSISETYARSLYGNGTRIQRLQGYLSANTASWITAFRLRKNGGNTALVANAPAGTTGWFTDTLHTVTPVSTDTLNLAVFFATGTGTVILDSIRAEMVHTGIKTIDGLSFGHVNTIDGLVQSEIDTVDGLQ